MKKAISAMLTLLMIFSMFCTCAFPFSVATLALGTEIAPLAAKGSGDVNGDGKVTLTDARWILQASVETRVLVGEALTNADLDGDGKITIKDARSALIISLTTPTVNSISINTAPTKLVYIQGTQLDVTGGKLNVNYSNSTSEVINITATMVSGYSANTLGTQTLTVTYDGQTTTFNVTVAAKALDSITMNVTPKTSYKQGELLDVTGGKLNALYNDGTTNVVDITAAMVSGFDTNKAGSQSLTVTYSGKTTVYTVNVLAKTVSSIAINTLPTKTSYTVGEKTINVAGGKLTITYSDATTSVIDMTVDMISGFDAATAGTKTITVTYETKTTTFTILVKAGGPPVDTYGNGFNMNYLCGVDMFGRTINPVSGFDKAKDVGIFYFLWNGQHIVNTSAAVYDISAMIAKGMEQSDVLNKAGTSSSPLNEYHYWGKPLFGYYPATDDWVIRRHVEMLTSAGVDFLMFDTTNAFTYDTVWLKILNILIEMQNQGWDVPQIAFYTNSDSSKTMSDIYYKLYADSAYIAKYGSLFYSPNGKPLIVGLDPSVSVANAMDVVPTYWPQQGIDGDYSEFDASGFPWMEWVFNPYNHNGRVSVSVAQHRNGRFSDAPVQPYGKNNWGRGCDASENRNANSFRQGQNFQRQWDNAINLGASTVFLTGWNEWIAIKHIVNGRVAFVDAYDEEFSRDIEPMRGGYEDSFYLQMIQNIRRYKGLTDTMAIPTSKTINAADNSSFAQWNDVKNIYENVQTKLYRRNISPVQGTAPVEDQSLYLTDYPLNNIQDMKVTHDANNVYFLVNTQSNIKDYSTNLVSKAVAQDRWMNVFITTGAVQSQGWEGYKYVVNRSASMSGGVGTGSICLLNADGTTGEQVGTAIVSYSGKSLQIAIPRTAIGADISCGGLYFKVADNIKNYLDINDYYISGKSMPMGRLSYYYYM